MVREALKRYFHLQGVDVGESTADAQRVKLGGEWHWIPKSVIHTVTRKMEAGNDELVIEEWFARKRGWM